MVLGGGRPLHLDEVLSSVERHHPALEAFAERVRSAEGLALAADGGFDPILAARGTVSALGYYEYGRLDISVTQATPLYGASLMVGYRIGRAVDDGERFPAYYGEDETLDGGELRAGLMVPLLRDGWTDPRRAGIERAGLATDVARAELDANALRLRLAATESYLRWVAAGRKLEIAEALLTLAEDRDGQLAGRVAAGALAAIEHLENRRAVLERRQGLVAAMRAVERAAIALSLYLRSEDGAPLVAAASRYPGLDGSSEPLAIDEAEALALALEFRPEMARMRARLRSAVVASELAENQLLPRLDVTVTGSMDVGADSNDSTVDRLGPPVLAGMATLSLPLFFREGLGRRDAAVAEASAVSADATLVSDTITLEVRDALSALRAAEASLELATESQRIAEAVAVAERARFEAGATTLLIVNLREATAAQAASSWVDARIELEFAHARVHAATGRWP